MLEVVALIKGKKWKGAQVLYSLSFWKLAINNNAIDLN